MKTTISELPGIENPILVGSLMNIATAGFVAVCSKAVAQSTGRRRLARSRSEVRDPS